MPQFKKPELPGPRKQLSSASSPTANQVPLDTIVAKYQAPRAARSNLIGLVDATGSMAPVWQTTQAQVTEMIRRVASLGSVKMNWVAYRDYTDGDRLIEQSGWHDKADPLVNFIKKVSCTGGADWEEAVEKALAVAADDQIATRVVLIGDAAPHQERDYKSQAGRLGQLRRPVYSFVVGDDPDTWRTFGEISSLSGGVAAKLRSVADLLDFVGMTMAHDMGGSASVEEYVKQHAKQLSAGAADYARLLLGPGRS